MRQLDVAVAVNVGAATILRLEEGDDRVAYGTLLKVCSTLGIRISIKSEALYMN